jgi:hypothetical protein
MATLASPGVSISVTDESFYTSSGPGTVPLIFVASAENKKNSSGTGIAQGTTPAYDGQIWLITSQRDLVDTFGTPLFYTDSSNNPVNAGEQNEYGLQAAYSLLGITSQVYVARAPIDLGALSASTSIPEGPPVAGTYWLDTNSSAFGIEVWNASGRGSFSSVTPLIINNDNTATSLTVGNSGIPLDSFGTPGSYAVVVTSDNDATMPQSVWYKTTATNNSWVEVVDYFAGGANQSTVRVTVSPHTQYPDYNNTTPTGSIWIKTTPPGNGANWVIKNYSGVTNTWNTVNAPIYNSTVQAISQLDRAGGGTNIPAGTLFVESDPTHSFLSGGAVRSEFKVWRRHATSPTTITSAPSTAVNPSTAEFTIRETSNNTSTWGPVVTITVPPGGGFYIGSLIASAINTSGLVNVSASFDSNTNRLSLTHKLGGDFEILDGVNNPLANANLYSTSVANLYAAPAYDDNGFGSGFIASNWKPLVYEASNNTPYTLPDNGTLWYDARLHDVDIMINDGSKWVGYKHYNGFLNGLTNGVNHTDPSGPIVSATEPTTQQDGSTALADGDIWVDTSDIDMYGKNVYVYDGTVLKWIQQDVTDHVSPNGWVFYDARWSDNGQDDMEYVTPISDLLVSNYVDPDVVDPALYPKGTRLWNLRRSGFTVKKYEAGYININANNGLNAAYGNDIMNGASPYSLDRWVSISPNNDMGVGTFGRLAQRSVVVKELKSFVDTNLKIRDTDTVNFNLIACPGYPEMISNMVGLNTDRGLTALVVGDTPFRLEGNANALTAWGTNSANAADNGDDGLVTKDTYTAVWYPSGRTTDNSGNNIVVPSSHMMLNTIINSDNVSYPWFAPAGTNRGKIINASSVGYVDSVTAEFKTVSLYQGLRDAMAPLEINPIATIPGVGLVSMGQYTLSPVASALDRINVARLVAYLRQKLPLAVKPFLFEPNDSQTRNEVKAAVESILTTLVGQRALNDFVVVCDSSNNTPTRIDQSQLWVDIAIEPVKAVEFIYIPLRLLNTGAIASGNLGAGFPGSSSGV